MCIDKLNQRAQKHRKRFAGASGCIYQTTLAINNMLPRFFLKSEGLKALCGQPLRNDFIANGFLKLQEVKKDYKVFKYSITAARSSSVSLSPK